MPQLCGCVDKATIAVATATTVIDREGQEYTEQQAQSAMSSDQLPSSLPVLHCQPDHHDYRITTSIGQGFEGCARIYVALHKPSSTFIVVKRTNIDFQSSHQLQDLQHEVQVLRSLHHPNILPLYSAFISSQELWTIFPLLSYGSCYDVLSAGFPDGMPEGLISCILRELFQGLEYLQRMSIVHRGIKGAHVLIGTDGMVCLSGFRNSIRLDRHGHKSGVAFDVPLHAIDVLPWMAPEILQQDLQGYNYAADIYSVGILAIELGHGAVPYSGHPPTKILLEKLQNPSPRLCDVPQEMSDTSTIATESTTTTANATSIPRDSKNASATKLPKKFSSPFYQIVDTCVQRNPQSRPNASTLLGHSFLKQVKKRARDLIPEYLSGVPLLTHRQDDRSLEQDLDSISAANSLASMSFDEWVF